MIPAVLLFLLAFILPIATGEVYVSVIDYYPRPFPAPYFLQLLPLPSLLQLSSTPNCQPCPFHIRHMATLSLILAQLRTCTLRTTLHHNIPLLIHQQPSLASTSLPAPSHAPLALPPARLKNSLDRVSSTGRHFPAGDSGYVGSGYVRGAFQFTLLLMFNILLGYYVIAIILSVITALITIYHHQIVAQLTPAAHTIKKSVLILILNPALLLLIMISTSLKGGWVIPIVILFIISFPPVRPYCQFPVLSPVDHMYHSSSVTKLLPFFVALFGVFGLDSRLLLLARFLENWATFSG